MKDLGELKAIQLRTKWTNEARDFTPWLALNIDYLNSAVGLELEVENTEVAVGPYSADVLAKDIGTGKYVIIENQLEKTNHDHLGKAITYASVLDASYIIWIASDFSDEHKKALDWLNDHTTDSIGFFGVKLELWQIDESLPAIKFNVRSQPNMAVRQAAKSKATEELSESRKAQLEFWTRFREMLAKTKAIPSLQTPRPQYWFDVSLGKTNIHLSNICNTSENKIGVRVYIGNKIADGMLPYLEGMKEEIEKEIGDNLNWNPNPENLDKVILLTRNANLVDESQWREPLEWLVEKTVLFRQTFSKRVRKYRNTKTN